MTHGLVLPVTGLVLPITGLVLPVTGQHTSVLVAVR